MAFKSLSLNDPILKALAEEGYTTPTPIQAKTIPPILEGRDILGCAQTGTGKTAAFALPIIQRLAEMPVDKSRKGPALPRALVLSPTRELAAQIGQSFATYGKHSGLSHTVIFGGVSQFHQVKAIHRGIDILIATPGRLMDLMDQRIVSLKDVKVFVLDEADRMLDMGFIEPIRRISSQLPRPRQTLLFSATMPKEIVHLAESLLKDPVRVAVNPVSSTAPKIEQSAYMVPFHNKQALLLALLDGPDMERVLVFTRTKQGAERVSKRLVRDGVGAVAIHGNKHQNFRIKALEAFRTGKSRVLVATDVAARGLDIDNVSCVINFDIPHEPEAYVHRIGRTGRAGATGKAIAFCDRAEFDFLRKIERLTGKSIPKIDKLPELPHIEPDRRQHSPGRPHGHHPDRRHLGAPPHREQQRPWHGHREQRERNRGSGGGKPHAGALQRDSGHRQGPHGGGHRGGHAARPVHASHGHQATARGDRPQSKGHHGPKRPPHTPGGKPNKPGGSGHRKGPRPSRTW